MAIVKKSESDKPKKADLEKMSLQELMNILYKVEPSIKENFEKFSNAGVKAACTRLRKDLQYSKTLSTIIRKKVQDQKLKLDKNSKNKGKKK